MSDPNARRRLLYFYIVGNSRDYSGRLGSWLPRLSGVPDATLAFAIDKYVDSHRDLTDVVNDSGENMLRDMFMDEKFIGILNESARQMFFEIDVDDVVAVLRAISAKGRCGRCQKVTDNGSCASCGQAYIRSLFPEIKVLATSIDKHRGWFSKTLQQAQRMLRQKMIAV